MIKFDWVSGFLNNFDRLYRLLVGLTNSVYSLPIITHLPEVVIGRDGVLMRVGGQSVLERKSAFLVQLNPHPRDGNESVI